MKTDRVEAGTEPRVFLELLSSALREIDVDAVERVLDVVGQAQREQRSVYIMGNGGSAATASHFACDLHAASRGSRPLRVSSLNDNVALLTALANDLGYENVFSEQLARCVEPGDIVFVLSASGDSPNIVRAVETARSRGARTIGLLGSGGGRVGELVDHRLVVSSREFGIVESVHNALEHLISASLRGREPEA